MIKILFHKLFSKPCIAGICSDTNTGKSNLIYYILDELKKDFRFKVHVYGLRCDVAGTLKFSSVEELEQIKDSLIIIDEMFSLFDLDNRKTKTQIENTIRLLFHNNNILLLCGLGENFKKFLSAKLSVIIFKKVTFSDLINGSSVKNKVLAYCGYEKGSKILNLAVDEAIIHDGLAYHKIKIPYLQKYDTKLKNVPILVSKKHKK